MTGAEPSENASVDDHSFDPDRHETPDQRSDRNWSELLQELRVMQVSTQILTGFLLTIPFQQRFAELDTFQESVFLVLLGLSVATTALFVTPVGIHRQVFHKHRKPELVALTNRIARIGLGVLSLAVTGTVLLIVDVVVGRITAVTTSAILLAVLWVMWFVFPLVVDRGRSDGRPGGRG